MRALLVCAAAVVAGACMGAGSPEARAEDSDAPPAVVASEDAASSQAAAVDVAALWKKHCKSCHGSDGKGKTKAGRAKKVKDLTDPSVVAEFDRAEMIRRVTEGIFDEKKKARMKPFEKKLSKAEIEALVDHVIGLSK